MSLYNVKVTLNVLGSEIRNIDLPVLSTDSAEGMVRLDNVLALRTAPGICLVKLG